MVVFWYYRRNAVGLYYFTTSGLTYNIISAKNIISLNKWHHIAMTYDKSENLITLWLDGRSVKTFKFTGTLSTSTNYNFVIGAFDGDKFFNGYLSNLRITAGGHDTVIYTGDTYPVPTSNFTNDTNTKLLIIGTGSSITDSSSSPITLPIYGSVVNKQANPFINTVLITSLNHGLTSNTDIKKLKIQFITMVIIKYQM